MTTEEIEAVLTRVRSWPKPRQEEAVELLLALETMGSGPYELSDEERRDIEAGLEEARNGEFASDEEVRALFDRYR